MLDKVERFTLGIYMANCYVLWKQKHVLLIDPGSSSRKLLQYLQENEAIVDGILLTHGHFDHIGGVDYFASKFQCPVYIDEEDKEFLTTPYLNCSMPGRETVIQTKVVNYKPNINNVGVFTFETIYAPGHTHGCTMLKFGDILFSGDVLFKQSIGRTDLPKGSNSEMNNTLAMIKTLNPDLTVYPGHGEDTILSEELKYNPYL